jgi:hypothetical protein
MIRSTSRTTISMPRWVQEKLEQLQQKYGVSLSTVVQQAVIFLARVEQEKEAGNRLVFLQPDGIQKELCFLDSPILGDRK